MSLEPTTVRRTPLLIARTSTGKDKFWYGRVLKDDAGNFYTQAVYWTAVTKGSPTVQESVPVLAKPKNVGKANETTSEYQANFEIDAKYRKQLDKGYAPEGEGETKAVKPPILPMTAHKFSERGKSMVFPAYVQLKENGFRCLFDGDNFWSRQGKIVNAEATKHLRFDTHERVYDGELVLPAPYTFQQTCSAIKKFDPLLSPLLEYRVYDLYDPAQPELPYHTRYALICLRHLTLPGQVRVVSTESVDDIEQLMVLHNFYTEHGHEGSMVRSINGVYKPGHRSADLLKVKDMQDDEFEIIGFTDGRGKDEGAIIFRCKVRDSGEFDVRPEGSMEERRRMFAEGESYVGKMLTVRYQTLTDGGVPLFPVGVAVRDYE